MKSAEARKIAPLGSSIVSVKLPIYTQVKRNLKLSTKSVIHHSDEILKTGFVKNLGKRIANVSIGIATAKELVTLGWFLGLQVVSITFTRLVKLIALGTVVKRLAVKSGDY